MSTLSFQPPVRPQLGLFCVAAGAIAIALGSSQASLAATITFDNVVTGATSFEFDGDGDGFNDVIFTTLDPAGFNTLGPGANQRFIGEPGLEGTSLLAQDLRVDFRSGAAEFLSFGFALNSDRESDASQVNFTVFDADDTVLARSSLLGRYSQTAAGQSSFPEGRLSVAFPRIATYAIFDFSSDFGRFIIDDLEGIFGSTEEIIAIPETEIPLPPPEPIPTEPIPTEPIPTEPIPTDADHRTRTHSHRAHWRTRTDPHRADRRTRTDPHRAHWRTRTDSHRTHRAHPLPHRSATAADGNSRIRFNWGIAAVSRARIGRLEA
ncbi:MAG: hypothetical protein HC824_07575 [Synechococcales cyanobacterium RM1_1_8]|nr:hypothetical protein [Synechococcales cyanobacterium RM1_1_8]